MSANWQKLSYTMWRLDDTWTVKFEVPYWSICYDDATMLGGFTTASPAMAKAERMREADKCSRDFWLTRSRTAQSGEG